MNLRHVLHVVQYDMRILARDRATLAWTFVFPVLLLLVFGTIFGGSGVQQAVASTPLHWASDDPDSPTPLELEFVRIMESSGWRMQRLGPEVAPDDRATEVVRRTSDTFHAPILLVLPQGFDEAVAAGSTVQVRTVVEPGAVQGLLMGSLSRALGSLYEAHAADAGEGGVRYERPFELVTEPLRSSGGAIQFYVPSLMAMNVLFGGLMAGVVTFGSATGAPVIKRVIVSPLRRQEWILAGLLNLFLSLAVSVVLILGVALVAYKVRVDLNLGVVLLMLFGALLMFSTGILFARTFSDPSRAVQFAPGIALALLFVSGVLFPPDLFPDVMRTLMSVLPTSHLATGLRYSMTYGDWTFALTSLLIVVGSAVLLAPLAIRSIKWRWE